MGPWPMPKARPAATAAFESQLWRGSAAAPRAGEALLRKLCVRSTFTDEERAVLLTLPVGEMRVKARASIVDDGETASRSCVLLGGMACGYKLLPDGSRQILSFYLAGDIVDLHSTVLKGAGHSIEALGPVRVAYIPHEALLDAAAQHRGIAWSLWREAVVHGAICHEWLLNNGQRDAYGRLAHLFCEMLVRMNAVGLACGESYLFPANQSELADATGLTTVHINRMMQRLRAEGLISTRGFEITIEDWNGLAGAASFDPAYLCLPPAAARCPLPARA